MKINKDQSPFFSIITCTYNSEKYIVKNLESVKSQTLKNYEQIIIDGKSKDKTTSIIKKFAENDPKIKEYSFPPKGISDAFNKGIEKSRGKYLFFLNSDDSFYNGDVLKNVSDFFIKNPKIDWIYGKINVVQEDGKSVGIFPKWKIFQISWKHLLKFINFIPHQAVFMRREVFEKFGNFDKSIKTNMDYDLWLRIAPRTKLGFYDRLISKYMIRKGSGSSDSDKKNQNLTCLEMVQKRHLNYFEMIPAKIANRLVMKINKTYR